MDASKCWQAELRQINMVPGLGPDPTGAAPGKLSFWAHHTGAAPGKWAFYTPKYDIHNEI